MLPQWAKKRIRRWLTDLLNSSESNDLEITDPMTGQQVTVTAVSIAGTMLLCKRRDGEQVCVTAQRAVDETRYWSVWKRLGGKKLTWSDGTPYDPQAT